MTEKKNLLAKLGFAFLLVLAVLWVYLPTLDFSYLRLDDAGYTVQCPFVKGGISLENVIAAFCDFGHGGIWMPLTYVTYMTDVSLFAGDWAGFHFTNVLLHSVNAVLLFVLLIRLVDSASAASGGCQRESRPSRFIVCLAAFVSALVWALHPMRAEAVAWVASRKEELWSLFAFVSLMSWLGFIRSPNRFRYLAAFAFFIFACLSKPTALALPFLLFFTERLVTPSRRLSPLAYLPFALIALAIGLLTVYSQSHPTDYRVIDIYDTTLAWRLLNASVAFGLFVFHSFIPIGLHIDYRAVFGQMPLHCALGLTSLVVALIVWLSPCLVRRWPNVRRVSLFSLGWFSLSLLPALGIFGIVGDHALADRYAYMPTVAFAFLLAWLVSRLSGVKAKTVALSISALAVVGALFVTIPYVRSFSNNQTAFVRVLKFDPDHWRALHFVGAELCARSNRFDDGLKMIQKSQRLSPRPSTAATLAYLLSLRGQFGDWAMVKRLGEKVARNPKLDREGMMLDALGFTALREGNDRLAVAYLTEALSAPRRQHTKSHAMLNLAKALANIGCIREATGILNELCRVRDKAIRQEATRLRLLLSQPGKRPRLEWANVR